MPQKIQTPQDSQTLTQRFGIVGRFPIMLDEIAVPTVQIADLSIQSKDIWRRAGSCGLGTPNFTIGRTDAVWPCWSVENPPGSGIVARMTSMRISTQVIWDADATGDPDATIQQTQIGVWMGPRYQKDPEASGGAAGVGFFSDYVGIATPKQLGEQFTKGSTWDPAGVGGPTIIAPGIQLWTGGIDVATGALWRSNQPCAGQFGYRQIQKMQPWAGVGQSPTTSQSGSADFDAVLSPVDSRIEIFPGQSIFIASAQNFALENPTDATTDYSAMFTWWERNLERTDPGTWGNQPQP